MRDLVTIFLTNEHRFRTGDPFFEPSEAQQEERSSAFRGGSPRKPTRNTKRRRPEPVRHLDPKEYSGA